MKQRAGNDDGPLKDGSKLILNITIAPPYSKKLNVYVLRRDLKDDDEMSKGTQ